MAETTKIRTLHREAGWSLRRIARELGCDRGTAAKYAKAEEPPGAEEEAKPAISTAGPVKLSAGRRSECEVFREEIEGMLEKGLSAERVWRELRESRGFVHSYESVKRFVRRVRAAAPKRVWRMECEPGEEAQVDFGMMRTLRTAEGKLRASNVLRVKLSFSRKGYTETLPSQSAECLIRALENAFRAFGGVPATVRLDNLKAAVRRADWHDPELNPKIEAFARHCGTAIIPTRPYCPEHKGKVESDIAYVKGSALKGREFVSIAEQNAHLAAWERDVADRRIHGTTRRQVAAHFEEHEKPALRPLPPSLFPCFQEGRRAVHRDSFVEVARAYYEAPPEFIGRRVWARWDGGTVRLFDEKMELIAAHPRLEPGRFSKCLGARGRRPEDAARTALWWVERAGRIGPAAGKWAAALAAARPETCIRALQGLLSLQRGKATAAEIERACEVASARGDLHLRAVRDILALLRRGEPPESQDLMPFLEEHPLIRPLCEYAALLEPSGSQPGAIT